MNLKRAAKKANAPEPASISPLMPVGGFPAIPAIKGVRFASVEAGVRYKGRADVMLAELAPGSVISGVFTRSATRAAPVLDCEAKIAGQSAEKAAIIVNAGNANAFTGTNGLDAVAAVTAAVATAMGVPEARVFSASTGVIGEPLAHDRITGKIDELIDGLSPDRIHDAAEAIRTTDTFAKGAFTQITIGGEIVTIAGFAKGSGMIAPDMATMLGFIFTDACVEKSVLDDMVRSAADQTFNCATVDGDTSTSDTVLVAATNATGSSIDGMDSKDAKLLFAALLDVMKELAQLIVRDGEGATKFVTVDVTGAANNTDAKTAGLAIANSPLVKTAIAGEDPNWGRIVMAVGKSGAEADRDLLTIRFGSILVAERGWVSPDYKEEVGAAYMRGDEINITVDLGIGDGTATVWTCDLTHGYISINADYRS
ncbi:MAG: bifunctional glutamate N-acetyltransferase/amino-acid acetyltransferase ArgJ [Pseudomonadota bacterium]